MTNTFYIKDQATRQAFQEAVLANTYWKPTWFLTKTFRHSTGEQQAIKEFRRWCKTVACKTGAHLFPIASVEPGHKRRTHIHACILLDRDIKYRAIQPTWHCGYSWANRWDPKKGGVVYLLTGHKFIPWDKPACKRTSKCRPKCKALSKFDWEWRQFTNGDLVSASDHRLVALSQNWNQYQSTGRCNI
tara:strand:- start:156 stop:719 length:564 start_codon:yes stop_codon:yes gene_type:complete